MATAAKAIQRNRKCTVCHSFEMTGCTEDAFYCQRPGCVRAEREAARWAKQVVDYALGLRVNRPNV